MEKFIYGIYDSVSGNVGDVCILDKDAEFHDGCLKLFADPRIPAYHVNDLVGACYGKIVFGNAKRPKIVPSFKVILRGDSFEVTSLRKDGNDDAEVSEDSEDDS